MKKKLIIVIVIFLLFTIGAYAISYLGDAESSRSVSTTMEVSEEANLFKASYSAGTLKVEHCNSCQLTGVLNSVPGEKIRLFDSSHYIDIENSEINKDGTPLTYEEKVSLLKEIASSEKGKVATETMLTDNDDQSYEAYTLSGTYEGKIVTYPLHGGCEIPTKYTNAKELLTTRFFSTDRLMFAGVTSIFPTAGVLLLISGLSRDNRKVWKIVLGIALILGFAGFLKMVFVGLKFTR